MDSKTHKLLVLAYEAAAQAREAFATLAAEMQAVLDEPEPVTMAAPIVLPLPDPMPAPAHVRLSPREKAILYGLMDGCSNKVIARKLNVAEATIKVHVKAVLRKLRMNNRTQAAIWAYGNVTVLAQTRGNGCGNGAFTEIHGELTSS
jgi:DNA-binding NarL/FixJ family response regulator